MVLMVLVHESLQIPTTAFCESQIVSCSLIYPVINGLITNHLVEKDDDLSVVQKFKKAVKAELKRRFDPSIDIESIPMYAAFLDPRYHHLKFLDPNLQSLASRAIKNKLEILFEENAAADHGTHGREPPPKKKED